MSSIIQKKISKVNSSIKEIKEEYDMKKKKNIEVSFKFPQDHQQHRIISKCAREIFATVYKHKHIEDKYKKELSFYTCKSKFCPLCNYNKSRKWSSAIFKRVTELQEKEEQRFIFLTLTVKNCKIGELDPTIKNMNRAWLVFWKKHLSKQFNGFVKILELTFPNGKDAHPHFHVLLSTNKNYFYKSNKKYLTTQKISEVWGRLLKVDYKPIVDIRIIKPKMIKGEWVSKEAIPAVVAEMTKYPMKDTDYRKLSEETMVILYEQLYRKRLIATGGNLKINISKIEKSDVEDMDEDEVTVWEKLAYLVLRYMQNGYVLTQGDYYLLDTKPKKDLNEDIEGIPFIPRE